mmetsp:Transcript_2953/g.7524  ORF Transcript_2953/g.7524 Transcript_2953/m.7524 type:complete len:777 (+) Transcript_2953:113-2443(+)
MAFMLTPMRSEEDLGGDHLASEFSKQRKFIHEALDAHLVSVRSLIEDLTKHIKQESQQQANHHLRLHEEVSQQISTMVPHGDSGGSSPKSPRGRSSPVVKSKRHSLSQGYVLNERWYFQQEGLDVTSVLSSSMDDLDHDNVNDNESVTSSTGANAAPRLVCMIRPSSLRRMVWDALSVLFIFYDVVSIPLYLAFDTFDNAFISVMFFIVVIFWSIDMGLSFITGVYVKGVEELRHSKVAKVYLKGWFWIDATLVGADWVTVIVSQRQSGLAIVRVGKSLRTLRIVRTLRLLRLIKIRHLLERVQDHISSEVFHIILKMVKLVVFVLLMNHLVACFWYWLGTEPGLASDGWVEEGGFEGASVNYRYFTALHWSLTQFTTGSMEVFATNEQERIFSVVTLVFALMIFSSFLSSITASMTQIQQLGSEIPQKMSQLRRYMIAKNIPQGLKIRVLRYVVHKLEAEKLQIPEQDVDLLAWLSEPLLRELKQHINQPYLSKHPLFNRVASRKDGDALQQLCNSALTVVPLSKGDSLFSQRASNGQMYFCMTGSLLYTAVKRSSTTFTHLQARARSSSSSIEDDNVLLSKDWCSEPALWTAWTHHGSMHATSVAEVLAVCANPLADVIRQHQLLANQVLQYARSFVEQLNAMLMNGSIVSDLAQADAFGIHAMAEEAFGKKDTYMFFGLGGARLLRRGLSAELPRPMKRQSTASSLKPEEPSSRTPSMKSMKDAKSEESCGPVEDRYLPSGTNVAEDQMMESVQEVLAQLDPDDVHVDNVLDI